MIRNILIALAIILLAVAGGLLHYYSGGQQSSKLINLDVPLMKLISPAFNHNSAMPAKYTCDGENISPPLDIGEVSEDTRSLVLIMDDPDAPGGTWLHWTLWNITPTTRAIGEASVPEGAVEGTTSFGNTGYGGPCPPSGEHRYVFHAYALDTELSLAGGASQEELEGAMAGHIIAQAELIGLYRRK